MPIKIPDELPARRHLEDEGVVVMGERDAVRQDIRPMRIAVLNLMPKKESTETQLTRLIGATPLQVELTLLTTGSYVPTNVSQKHLSAFYHTWEDVKDQKFDGLIVTGAPIETLPFEDVHYWAELTRIFDWTQSNVHSTFNICWGAQAALKHFRDIPKHELPGKMFGVFEHAVTTPGNTLLRGFNDIFRIPVSRHTETRREDLPDDPMLQVLAESPESGLCLVQDQRYRQIYIFNHLEYDARTLADEYNRDVSQGLKIDVPKNYFPDDDPSQEPRNRWRAHAHLLFSNWINDVYQSVPFHVEDIGKMAAE
ncbi:homoserine O-acetyltransferase MetA [Hwanghaeella sp.]|uniref:homoserine O-acetyltransferase MetA n=1 Tax=Hwanghaeella sp. TaxID=2605943 RepID=UPI003CCBB79D